MSTEQNRESEFLNGLEPGVKIKLKNGRIIDFARVQNSSVQDGGVVLDGFYFRLEEIESISRVEDASKIVQPPKLLDHLTELFSYFMPRRQR